MRKNLNILVGVIFFISLFSVSSAFAGSIKVAVVDVNEVVENYQEFKDGLEKLKTEFIEKQTDLDTRMKALAAKEANLKKQLAVMDEAKKEELRKELETEFKKLQSLFNQYQQELSEQEKQLFEKLEQKVLFIVEDIAKNEKYTIVLKKQATLYYDKSLDITKKVQDRLYR
ncbi:OmpH family outer membrane protein [Candidatus Dependentiae bacterium]|nr:OmpH family outer membrane protein [Candidatus Dependentiae bacterium]